MRVEVMKWPMNGDSAHSTYLMEPMAKDNGNTQSAIGGLNLGAQYVRSFDSGNVPKYTPEAVVLLISMTLEIRDLNPLKVSAFHRGRKRTLLLIDFVICALCEQISSSRAKVNGKERIQKRLVAHELFVSMMKNKTMMDE